MATIKPQPQIPQMPPLPQFPQFPPLGDLGTKTFEAISAVAEANQRVVGQLIELTSAAASERLRTLGELQSATVQAAREAMSPADPREAFEDFRQDPFGWYRKGVLTVLDGTQRVFKLFEAQAQIVSKNAERMQGTAERTGKEIESAVSTCTSRLREIYGAKV